jgi:chromosome partitioning protein
LTQTENAPNLPICTSIFGLMNCHLRATQMHAIVLATQKGGSGKSTLAIGLAIAALDDGLRVGVIDADPQGTISNWGRRRTNPKPRIERAGNGAAIERTVLDFRRDGFAVAIIDTAATDNMLSAAAIGAADLCLIPARPSPADIEAAAPTIRTVRRLDKRFAFELNQTPARSTRTSEAATALHAAGVLALPCIVQRNDHQDAFGIGLGVTEYDSHGKAAEEIRGLWRWIWKSLTRESFDHEPGIRAAG